jgi:xanthine/uracil permease
MPFFGKNDETPIVVAGVMGLQHAFAMLGGRVCIKYQCLQVAHVVHATRIRRRRLRHGTQEAHVRGS